MSRRAATAVAVALLAAGCTTPSADGPSSRSSSTKSSAPSSVTSSTPSSVPSTSAPSSRPAPSSATSGPAGRATRAKPSDATALAVGDIARCSNLGDETTAAIATRLLAGAPKAAVLTLGDHAYPDGSRLAFAECYQPSWGRLTSRVHPAPGNHDYVTPEASAYFDYFGAAAGARGKGWYSYQLGTWHVVALNSNCSVVGCGPTSAQVRWLQSDLAHHRSRCTLAYWHHPRFSSGWHGSSDEVATLWATLDRAGADVVLNGHDHDYERFAPQRADGRASASGMREFVVGTGGGDLRAFAATAPNSQKRISGVHAVLQLRLRDGSYEWALVGTAGAARPLDSGTGTCS